MNNGVRWCEVCDSAPPWDACQTLRAIEQVSGSLCYREAAMSSEKQHIVAIRAF